jgi:sodium--glutamate symport carrier gltS
MTLILDLTESLIITGIFLAIGKFISERIRFFKQNCVSIPFTGGLAFLLVKYLFLKIFNITICLNTDYIPFLSAAFFATLGWGIGHFILFVQKIWLDSLKLLFLCFLLCCCQNIITPGISSAVFNSPASILDGSVCSMGDYDFTGSLTSPVNSRYAALLKTKNLSNPDVNTNDLVADFKSRCAFNLLAAALLGGFLGIFILKKRGIESPDSIRPADKQLSGIDVFTGKLTRHTNADQLMNNSILILVFILMGKALSGIAGSKGLFIPLFAGAFICASLMRIINHYIKIIDVKKNTDTINMIGYVFLFFFLISAFMNIHVSLASRITERALFSGFINLVITVLFTGIITPLLFKNPFAGSCYALGLFSFGFGGGAATLSNVKTFTGRFGFSVKCSGTN